jgi:hypothetical protein
MRRKLKKTQERIEFGDFQTPSKLAREICSFLYSQGLRPQSVVEPTCGRGSFVLACLEMFGSAKQVIGIDINDDYLTDLRNRIPAFTRVRLELSNRDFFQIDWQSIFDKLPKPLLIVGNPPWVTSSQLGTLNGTNLPSKSNFQKYKGLDAVTGKSNFDISEWMLMRLCDWMQKHDAFLAMLCKTTVARKVLRYAWRNEFRIRDVSIHIIDTKRYFGASVEGCLLTCRTGDPPSVKQCPVYEGFSNNKKISVVGLLDAELVADLEKYRRWSFLDGIERYRWRSGVKHDCAKVMEFVVQQRRLRNGLGEFCDFEKDFLYPLFKGSDIVANRVAMPKRWVLVTQKDVYENTSLVKEQAPKTWQYLIRHRDRLDNRKSSVYKGRPPFSMFGIGEYAFCLWKVCICGLYKKFHFAVVGPYGDRPPMVDDTCYYIGCNSEEEALLIASLLNSEPAKEFLSSLVFWDSKRPITNEVLRRLDLIPLSQELGVSHALDQYVTRTLFDQQKTRPATADKEMIIGL